MPEALLTLTDLGAGYGAAQVLFGANLGVASGEVVALIGRNGAGKSSLLKAIMGLMPVTRGSVRLRQAELVGRAPFQIAREGIGYVPEQRRIFTTLTVAENLDVGRKRGPGAAPRLAPWEPERIFDLFPVLRMLRDRRGAHLSGGEQQMLTIARTLMGNPELVLLDEPSEGVAPVVLDQLAQMIVELRQQGLTIVLSEQNLAFARHVATRAVAMERGSLRPLASIDQVNQDSLQ